METVDACQPGLSLNADRTLRGSIWRAAVRVAIGALCVVLMASGCAGAPSKGGARATPEPTAGEVSTSGAGAADGPESVTPEVGACWVRTEGGQTWLYLQTAAERVDCAEPHNAITYAVHELSADEPWPQSGKHRVDADVAKVVWGTCEGGLNSGDLANWDAEMKELRFIWLANLPTREQWADGERWVRCDLSLLRLGARFSDGYTGFDPEDFEDLPPSLADLPAEDASRFRICTDGDPAPLSDGAVLVDCFRKGGRQPGPKAKWGVQAALQIPIGFRSSTPYPGRAYLKKMAAEQCFNPLSQTQFYWPSEGSWGQGDRTLFCFMSTEGISAW